MGTKSATVLEFFLIKYRVVVRISRVQNTTLTVKSGQINTFLIFSTPMGTKIYDLEINGCHGTYANNAPEIGK